MKYKLSKLKIGGSIYRKSIFQMAKDEDEDFTEKKQMNIKMAESDASSDDSVQVKYCPCFNTIEDPSTSVNGF